MRFIGGIVIFSAFIASLCLAQSDSPLLTSAKKKYQAGDINGAIADYSAAIRLIPQSESAYYERGRIYNEQKKYLDAINDFTKVIEINPKNYRALYLRGYTKFLTGNYRGAVDDLNLSIGLYANSALAYWYRAEAKKKLGEKTGACEDWDKAYRLGYFEATAKINANCQGVELSSEVTADEYLRNGDLLLDKGDAAAALDQYLKAKELHPQSGMIIYSIGLAKIILKDPTGACEAWEEAAGLGSPEAKQMIKQHCR